MEFPQELSSRRNGRYSQFQEGEVGIAVVSLVFALGCHVVVKDARRLGVVAIQAVEDGINVLWPLGRIVERYTHD